jgi:hypothetical protein
MHWKKEHLPTSLRYAIFIAVRLRRILWPRTLDDKIARKMVRDRRPILTRTADKVDVREFVSDRVTGILTHIFQVVEDARDIDWQLLPADVAIKSNHGCSGSIIMSRDGDPLRELLDGSGQLPKRWTTYRVQPVGLGPREYAVISEYLNWLLSQRYGWGSPIAFTFEWAYRDIKPRILIEELLQDDGMNPIDYRFFVLGGAVSWIQRDYKRDGQHFSSVHLPDWRMLQVRYNYDLPPEPPPAPAQLAEMCRYAEILAAQTDFCRVDFYNFAGRVVFGEITHYPRGGNNSLTPKTWATTLGSGWSPPWHY